mmetsp:Transcript_3157/g.7140  ORF Transcript_3157/g.7140 Transcript_3157/m.7140 type:complete len:83 (-) Transcript_3157:47-295(-)
MACDVDNICRAALLNNLETVMHDDAKARLERHCGASLSNFQAALMDTLPNIISIAWQAHAGEDHLQACIRAIQARLTPVTHF